MSGSDPTKRRAGIVVPLSALRCRQDNGVGSMGMVGPLLDWMRDAGFTVLQLLPFNDLAPLDSSPYSPVSAFALDPLYAALDDIPELSDPPAAPRRRRSSARVSFADARAYKVTHLRSAFRRFMEREYGKGTARAQAFDSFCREQKSWLVDYALFRILKERGQWNPWQEWEEGYRLRYPEALDELRRSQERAVMFYQFAQWVLETQWQDVRQQAARRGILLYGDIPFGLSRQSADVWMRQDQFDFTATMGAPPDQYSVNGQAWGLPAYRWDLMERSGHEWWRMRVARARRHFDLFRLDHAVGFFRTWLVRRGGAENSFDITAEAEQRARGERFFKMALQEGHPARPIAEDLGLIPPFVRAVLDDLGIPGYKITRWEKNGDVFQNPRTYSALSVAAHGNHDTSTLAAWWSETSKDEKDAFWRMVTNRQECAPRFSPAVLRTVLENLYHAGSSLVMLPFQDAFGARERINIPATVRSRNWTYRIPMAVEDLLDDPKYTECAGMLRALAEASGRA
ncbi:MAG: 4-alpha-glucanotransferase [Elusimicrobiota bacterium]